MNDENDAAILIQGITESGGRFRPSDWAERLAGNYARLDWDRRLVYSDEIAPTTRDGMVCLVVRGSLARSNPSAYAEVMCFARMNHLVCIGPPGWSPTPTLAPRPEDSGPAGAELRHGLDGGG